MAGRIGVRDAHCRIAKQVSLESETLHPNSKVSLMMMLLLAVMLQMMLRIHNITNGRNREHILKTKPSFRNSLW